MAAEHCAQGAPRGRSVPAPTGYRRRTPRLVALDEAVKNFTGFPKGVTLPWELLAAVKSAAPRLGLGSRELQLLDYLFSFTQAQDWQKDSRPIVWPSNWMIERTLGLSLTQVKEYNRRLIEHGLVTMQDSPTGRRYGNRDRGGKGRITEAYGYDLSPVAVRHREFLRLAEEEKAERKAITALRRRATIAGKIITQILETAQEYGFAGKEWEILRRETGELRRALKGIERPDELETGVASLERRQQAAHERLAKLLQSVDSTRAGAENRPPLYNYNPTYHSEQNTVIATDRCNGAGETPPSQTLTPVPQGTNSQSLIPAPPARTVNGRVYGIDADELPQLAPKLRQYLRGPDPDWRDIIDAADWLRGDLGISKPLWGEACLAMGRELAAVAVAIVSTKAPEHFRTTPGGYFHGMVARHIAGELRLERTIWALRRAADPDRFERGKQRARDRGAGYRAW
jgi:replication initiation protein RepC